MNISDLKTAIIIPCYNEEQSIAITIKDYKAHFPFAHIVVVNNNSSDNTAKFAKNSLNIDNDLLLNEFRQGKGWAVKCGLARIDADIYVLIDGDATYRAQDAKKLYDNLLYNRLDMVIGDRISGGDYKKQNDRFGHSIGNKLLTSLISKFSEQNYNDVLSGMRVMSKPFVSMVDFNSSGFQLETELNMIAAYLKVDVREMPIKYDNRLDNSVSKLNTIEDGIKILAFAFFNWIYFSPIKPFIALSIVMTMTSSFLGYRVVYGFLDTGMSFSTTAIASVATGLIAVLSFFFGITLKSIVSFSRRSDITKFLNCKRKWNNKLDKLRF